jgi:hypothetical protein
MKPMNLQPLTIATTFADLDFAFEDKVITIDDVISQAKDTLRLFDTTTVSSTPTVEQPTVEDKPVIKPLVMQPSHQSTLLAPVSLIDEDFEDEDDEEEIDTEFDELTELTSYDEIDEEDDESLVNDVREFADWLVLSYLPIGLRNSLPKTDELPNKLNLYLTELYVRDIMRLQDQLGVESKLEFPQLTIVDQLTNGELPDGYEFDTYKFVLKDIKPTMKIHDVEYQLIQTSFKDLAAVATQTVANPEVKHIVCTTVNAQDVLTSSELQCIIYLLV